VFDKARWVATPPRFRVDRYQVDRYLVLRLVPEDQRPRRVGPEGGPPASPDSGPGPGD
jgi:hypothetical protein